jgi:hypothetical protein
MHNVYEPSRSAVTEGIAVGGQTEMNRSKSYQARTNQAGGFAESADRQIAASTQNRISGANRQYKQMEDLGALLGVEKDRMGKLGILQGMPNIPPMNFSPSGSYLSGLGAGANQFASAWALKDPTQKKQPGQGIFYGTPSHQKSNVWSQDYEPKA